VRTEQLGATLASFVSAPHRIELVGNFGGVDWFDDSKATSPHAALTAIRAFDSVVLIAGGKNKDLDLTELAIEPHRIHGVVAIGHDAPAIQAAFAGVCPVQIATSMAQAVELAAQMSNGRVPVLLSPACTSYDWYRNYNERGDDFQKCVKDFFETNSGVA
jgi:UDP-N-acetylmuramoylalanine--D-glutamate ligase